MDTRTYRVGDRIRTTVDAPAVWEGAYAAPAGTLGTIIDTKYGPSVMLDTDPHRLPADYSANELEPA
jgi:hypothetical protein